MGLLLRVIYFSAGIDESVVYLRDMEYRVLCCWRDIDLR